MHAVSSCVLVPQRLSLKTKKPQRLVLVNNKACIKLVDFGGSKQVAELVIIAVIIGKYRDILFGGRDSNQGKDPFFY